MRKVLFFTSSLSYGGKERQTIEMIKLLSSEYFIILMVLNPTKISFIDSIIIPNFKYQILSPNSKNIIKRLYLFYIALSREKPDIIHSMDAISSYFGLLVGKLFRIPLINGSIRHAGVTHGLVYMFEKVSLVFSDYVIANSIAGLKYYNSHQSPKACVIYNFIDTSRFQRSSRKSPSIVMTANFSPYKDHITMLLCAERLFAEHRIQELHLIGDGVQISRYKEWVNDHGLQDRVVFWGKIIHVEEVLSKCSIGVLCSTEKYKEGISNSILEYMGSGLISIASDIGGTSEIIEHGKNGLLFEVENPESLYKCIDWALTHNDECGGMILEGYKTLENKFSAQTNSKLLTAVYTRFI